MVYPRLISDRAARASAGGGPIQPQAAGAAANFRCGSFVRIALTTDEIGVVDAANVRSNGCGYMLAAAGVLREAIAGRNLTELHGLQAEDLGSVISVALGRVSEDRADCISAAIEALREAFADLRTRRIEEYRGEDALICTCFGITQERIETVIASDGAKTVDDVSAICRAGSGCGSCRMLIQELLDHADLPQ